MSPTVAVKFSAFGRQLSTCMNCGWSSKEGLGPTCCICGAVFDTAQITFQDGTVLRVTKEKGPEKESRPRSISELD